MAEPFDKRELLAHIARESGLTEAQVRTLPREELLALCDRLQTEPAARAAGYLRAREIAGLIARLADAYSVAGHAPLGPLFADAGIDEATYPPCPDQFTADDCARFRRAVTTAIARLRAN
jgi:hypothetical protein